MSFLAKLGKWILEGLGVVSALSDTGVVKLPGLGSVQVLSKDLTEMANIVLALEVAIQAKTLTIDQALQVEAAQIAQIILASSILAGKHLSDPTLITGPNGAAVDFANGVAKILKAINPDEAKLVQTQSLT